MVSYLETPNLVTNYLLNKKTKVLFIYHGGTIGMRVEQLASATLVNRVPQDSTEFQATTSRLLDAFTDTLDISYRHITSKDSSNVHPGDWSALAETVYQAQQNGFDAVAIAHGTDTLQYTATALAFAVHGSEPTSSALKIPVVLTGAQNSIYVRGGDGEFNLINLFRTVQVAVQKNVADVLINFWDLVLLGCRAVKVNERRFRAFESPAYPPVGTINAYGVDLNTHLVRQKHDKSGGVFAPKFCNNGLISIDVEPGFDTAGLRALLETGRYKGILLKSMGDGNIPTQSSANLLPLIEYATNKLQVPIFLTVKTDGATASGSHYDVGIEAVEAGAIPCFDHSSSAVAVKVRWLIGNGLCQDIPSFNAAMATSFVGEVSV